jgi:hypothetical protein
MLTGSLGLGLLGVGFGLLVVGFDFVGEGEGDELTFKRENAEAKRRSSNVGVFGGEEEGGVGRCCDDFRCVGPVVKTGGASDFLSSFVAFARPPNVDVSWFVDPLNLNPLTLLGNAFSFCVSLNPSLGNPVGVGFCGPVFKGDRKSSLTPVKT